MSSEPAALREDRYRDLTQVLLLNEEDRRRTARLRIGGLALAGAFLILPLLFWTPVDIDPGAPEFFRTPTPHEGYFLEMARAGIGGAGVGRMWLHAAFRALDEPILLEALYEEGGTLLQDRPHAWGFRVHLERGQQLAVGLAPEVVSTEAGSTEASQPPPPVAPGYPRVFVDLHRAAPIPERRPVPLLGAEMAEGSWEHQSTRTGPYVLRLQPEIRWQGPYRLTLRVEPSLRFPVVGRGMEDIGGVFGDPREGGRRAHHGVDIFAPRGTPVLAAADGRILAADTTTLGGRVVWQRTSDGRLGLYYAHMNRQLVREGQQVTAGDTIGLVGNTGNARTTPPHLHFGVYSRGEGAVDPWYFIAPVPHHPPSSSSPPDRPSSR